MDWVLVVLTIACFAAGILLSRWQTRKQYRKHLAEKLAREVEKQLAKQAMERFAGQQSAPSQANTGASAPKTGQD